MKLPGSTKRKINKKENGANIPNLEITEIVLEDWNIFNNNYQQSSTVFYTFVPNNSFGQLLDKRGASIRMKFFYMLTSKFFSQIDSGPCLVNTDELGF